MSKKKLYADIDILIEEQKTLTADIERLNALYSERVSRLTIALETELNAIQSKITYNNEMLKTLSKEVDMKETKTQHSYKSLSGSLVIKKPVQKINRPTKEQEKKLLAYYPAYKKIVTTESLDWKEFKDTLFIENDKVICKETGEIIGVEITSTEEQVVIK